MRRWISEEIELAPIIYLRSRPHANELTEIIFENQSKHYL